MKTRILCTFKAVLILIIALETTTCQVAETTPLHHRRGNQHLVSSLVTDHRNPASRQTTGSRMKGDRNDAQQSSGYGHLTSGTQNMNTTGIEGRVTVGPISPVERPGVTNDSPYEATITVLDQAGRVVSQVKSDTDGHFQINLSSGQYTLRPESPGARPYAKEQAVTVTETGFTSVQIQYDSGIR